MTEPAVMREAIEALRGMSGHTHDPDLTRRRIVGTVTRRKRQRRQVIAMLLSAGIGLPLGTTAYAAFFGTPAFVRAWIDRPVATNQVPRDLTPRRRVTVERPLSTGGEGHDSSITNVPRSVTSTPIPAVATPTVVHIPLATRGEGNRSPMKIDRGEVAPTIDPSEALYERAHELHFVARDPAAALDAWNAYIEGAHDAALLPEANYNRALCLIRLHRNAEAIDALTPFANGTNGDYRKREATALLRALTP